MAFKSSWLIGSYRSMPAQGLEVSGDPATVTAGSRYLYDFDDDLSLLRAVEIAAFSTGVTLSAFLTESRHVRLESAGVFSIDWTDPLLPSLLGFTVDLAGQSSYTAPRISPLLWSPGRPESTSMAPLGVRGHKVHSTYQSVSPYDGTTESITHGSREYNKFSWLNVAIARVWTASELGGEFRTWFQTVSVPANNFKLYRSVPEVGGSSNTEASIVIAGLGPYCHTAERRGVDWQYDRSKGLEFTDTMSDIVLPVHVVPELEG